LRKINCFIPQKRDPPSDLFSPRIAGDFMVILLISLAFEIHFSKG